MGGREYILAINPGSTSTKVAIFRGEECIKQKNLNHLVEEVAKFEKIYDQFQFRMDVILKWLEEEGINTNTLVAVVGRGGLIRPMPGGTYIVTDCMIEDLKAGVQDEHVSNLGGILARGIADREGIPSYIVDPVAVDEFEDVARLSGLPELSRRSLIHALNIKAICRRAAKDLGKTMEELNFVAVHLGGGISVAPVKKGRAVDVNDANGGGPFSPNRSGGVPVGDLVRLAYSGKYTLKELRKKTNGEAGLIGYLGTNDVREVEKMIDGGDKKAKLIFEAMCYQISKEIGSMAAVLSGNVDAILLTGGMAYSKRLVELVSSRVSFIAPVMVYPGEDEMLSLAQGAYRVIKGEEKAKIYEDEVFVK